MLCTLLPTPASNLPSRQNIFLTIGQYFLLSVYFLPGLGLLLPLHCDIPVVHPRRGNLQCLYPRMSANIS